MNRHASMKRIFRSVWSPNAYVWVAKNARGRGNSSKRKLVAAALSLSACIAHGAPTGAQVTAGNGTVTQSGSTTTIQQSSQNLALNWLTFNIAPQETVDFVQPNATAIAVNRILDPNGSVILGHLNANGEVYLFNPNGVLFGKGAEVNVGGLVASTLNLNDGELGTPSTSFSGTASGSVVNAGTLTAAAGGSIALLGNHVSNTGVISAQLGTVALGAGSAATLTFQGTHLVSMQIDQSVLNSIAANGGLIRADGGQVLMTAGAQKTLLASVVNNTGVIEARTLDNHDGTITLLGGMQAGTVNVAGTLDASAPSGGDGGFIETSAARVEVANAANITSAAASGKTGTWRIDPQDFTVAPSGGDMTGATLSTDLASNNVQIQSSQGAQAGNGDININDTVTWSAHTLTLTAANNINVNAVMTASGAASLDLEPATANGADAAVAGGTVNMGMDNAGNFTGQVNFSGSGTLTMGGQVYTVINSLGSGAADTTPGTLQGMQANLSGHYALGSNIDASATAAWNGGAGFTPIGSNPYSQGQSFAGVFDGLGHTISGLTFNSASTEASGLFGAVSGVSSLNPAFVRNVALTGVVQNCLYGEYCAGLVGYVNQYTTIANVSISGTVSGTEIEYAALGVGYFDSYNYAGPTFDSNIINAYVAGTISGNEVEDIGGLVGELDGGIVGAHSSVTINLFPTLSRSGGEYIGGLVGYIDYGTIDKSSASGNITLESSINGQATSYGSYEYIGGLAGESGLSITNSHATGSIIGLCTYGTCLDDDETIGGLVGFAYGLISNSYSTGAITLAKDSNYYVGGLAGDAIFGSVLHSYSTSPITAPGSNNEYFGGLLGATYYETITTDYAAGAVTVGANAAHIGGFLGYANSGNNNFSISYSTGAVTAGAASSQLGGFIGYVDTANISNVYTTGSVTSGAGSSQVGGLIGSANGAVVLSNSYAVGAVSPGSGATNVGGLVGYDSGSNTVSNTFWDITSTGQATSADGQGMTTAQMQQQINFASATSANGMVNPNWDFAGTWVMYNGHTYPLLQAFMTPLTVTGTVAQTYNGTAFAPTISALTYSVTPNFNDLFGTLTVTGSAVGAVHAGTYSYTPGGLYSDQQGYIIQPYVAGTLTINPALLTVSGTTVGSKVYNGTTAASLTGGSLVGVIGDDAVTLTQAGTFASKNAGTGIAVTAADGLGGAEAIDYTIVEPTGLSGNITPATLMVSGTTVGSKVYNGTAAAPLSGGTLVGVVSGDTVSLNQSGLFASTSAGTGIAVTATDTLSGASADDYSIAEPTGLIGSILPAPSPPNGPSDLVLAALNARTQIVENFIYPQLGANPQVINPSPTIAVLATTADGAGEGATGSQQAIAVNVSMKIGATGTLKIENGGLRLPSNLVLGNE